MDWLFGSSNKGKGDKGGAAEAGKPGAAATTLSALSSGVDKPEVAAAGGGAGQFDPTVLERIAAAARELQTSTNAKEIIDLAREQEKSWQAKYNSSQAENLAKAKQAEIESVRVANEEHRKTIEEQSRHEQARSQYQDQLARKRYDDQLAQQRDLNEKSLRAQEASVMKQEAERRRTVEYEQQLRQQTELLKVRAEAEARAKQERENKDIRKEQLILQAEQHRITVLEGIKQAGTTIGDGFRDFVSDPYRVAATAASVTALALGIYGARSATTVMGKYAAARLAKPPLVRDTSRTSALLQPVATLKKLFQKKSENILEGIILSDSLKTRLQSITVATARTRQYGANFRHLMLHGPPGTGKTMFARRLAQQSGLEYAMLAGGDVGPLGPNAVTELHKVFDWAKTSKKGVLLFIDESDAFLRKRSGNQEMSENLRNALSTFLYRTGDPTNKFMLVFATNEPQMFDRAVTDRVDEVVEFDLPDEKERCALLELYFDQYISKSARKVRIDESVNRNWEELAGRLKGFSGRQISKLCHAWQSAAIASADNTLTKKMMLDEIESHITQNDMKNAWEATGLRK